MGLCVFMGTLLGVGKGNQQETRFVVGLLFLLFLLLLGKHPLSLQQSKSSNWGTGVKELTCPKNLEMGVLVF